MTQKKKEMASIKEKVLVEGERGEPGQYRRVHLWHEGSFLRAYEWSAWLLCRYVHEFKVTRRQFKGLDTPVVFVGFPIEKKSLIHKGLDCGTDHRQW